MTLPVLASNWPRASLQAGMIAVIMTAAQATSAQTSSSNSTYPNNPVKMITQGAAGSGPDFVARIVSEQLGRQWKQQVVVSNHPGAGGSLAARAATAAAHDGYTLFMAPASAYTIMPAMFPGQDIDMDRDFALVGFVGEQPMVIAVAPSLGVNSLAELIALAKTKPGEILYAASANGTPMHLTVERFKKEAGVDLKYVPYPGAAAGLQDLLGGRISMIVDGMAPFVGNIEAGKLKALAVASLNRLPDYPNLPAAVETLPGFVATGWFALTVPAKTPTDITQQIRRDLQAVLDTAETKQKFSSIGFYSRSMSPAELTSFVKSETAAWKPFVPKSPSPDQKR